MGSTRRRKARSDRYHVLYCLTAPNEEFYVGVTYARGDTRSARARLNSVHERFVTHCRNAVVYRHTTHLAAAIRRWGAEAFRLEVLEVVRGKQPAHDRERALIAALEPTLNTTGNSLPA